MIFRGLYFWNHKKIKKQYDIRKKQNLVFQSDS